jgi:hypothetical protein
MSNTTSHGAVVVWAAAKCSHPWARASTFYNGMTRHGIRYPGRQSGTITCRTTSIHVMMRTRGTHVPAQRMVADAGSSPLCG